MIRLLMLSFFCLTLSASAQKSKIIHLKDLQKLLANTDDSLTVINFWASWCKPCVAELPNFETAKMNFEGKPVRFWLISLDFADQKRNRLDPFIANKKLKSKVFLLDETDYDSWIPLVDPSWQGAIPVTLFVNNSKNQRKFVEGELSLEKLNEIIQSQLQP